MDKCLGRSGPLIKTGIHVLYGENGSGKTRFLRSLAGDFNLPYCDQRELWARIEKDRGHFSPSQDVSTRQGMYARAIDWLSNQMQQRFNAGCLTECFFDGVDRDVVWKSSQALLYQSEARNFFFMTTAYVRENLDFFPAANVWVCHEGWVANLAALHKLEAFTQEMPHSSVVQELGSHWVLRACKEEMLDRFARLEAQSLHTKVDYFLEDE